MALSSVEFGVSAKCIRSFADWKADWSSYTRQILLVSLEMGWVLFEWARRMMVPVWHASNKRLTWNWTFQHPRLWGFGNCHQYLERTCNPARPNGASWLPYHCLCSLKDGRFDVRRCPSPCYPRFQTSCLRTSSSEWRGRIGSAVAASPTRPISWANFWKVTSPHGTP